MLDKSQLSFLIGVARQLEVAVARRDRDSLCADVCESLAGSLGVLIAGVGDDPRHDDGGDDEGFDPDDDVDGDEPSLGSPLEREDSHPPDVVRSRRLVGGGASRVENVGVPRNGRKSVLKGGKRRGKK